MAFIYDTDGWDQSEVLQSWITEIEAIFSIRWSIKKKSHCWAHTSLSHMSEELHNHKRSKEQGVKNTKTKVTCFTIENY